MSPDEPTRQHDKVIDGLQAELSRKNKEIEIVLKISSEINSSLDVDEIASVLLSSMDEIFGFEHSMILLREESGDTLRVVATHGYEEQGTGSTVRVGQGVIGVVAQKKRLMRMSALGAKRLYMQRVMANTGETQAEEISLPGLPDSQSQVAVPMLNKDDLVGVFVVESPKVLFFDKKDEILVSILANQAAIAFHNAHLNQRLLAANASLQEYSDTLEQKVKERTRELSALHDTSLGLLNRLDLNEVLETLVTEAGQLLGTPHGYIYLIDPFNSVIDEAVKAQDRSGKTELERKVGVGVYSQSIGFRLKPGEGLAGMVWQTGQPLVVNNYDTWPGRTSNIKYDVTVRALMGVPLNSGSQVVGVIGLGYDAETDRTFSDSEIELLSRFAQLASIALDNARLFEAEQRQRQMAESLRQVAAVLSASLDRNTVLSKIIEQLQRFIDYDSAVILLRDEDELVISDLIGLPSTAAIGYRIPLASNSPAIRAFRSCQPFAIADVQADPDWVTMEGSQPIRSWMGIPLVFGEEPIGVLTVNSVKVNAYDEKDLQLVRAFANHAAIAIENAWLFEETQQTNRELSQTLDDLKTTQNQLVEAEKMAALGGLVAGVAHEINTPVGIGVTAASLLNDKTVAFHEAYRDGQLKRSELEKYLNTAVQSSSMILKNLSRAAELIQSFKQVAVDQSTEERRSFLVKSYVEEILLSLHPKLKQTQHTTKISGDDRLILDSYPGVLSQIVTNLVMNSLMHAYEADEVGQLTFQFKQEAGRLIFEYADDGRGIPEENLNKIFDPFFTTKRGQGGSGLGLHIIYNLVTQKLEGTIRCESGVGVGTRFIITLPLA